jgi:hypothetical protein
MDNSMCHNARKISLDLEHNKAEGAPHTAYFPNISPCDFWLFGFLKKLTEQELSTSGEIIQAITTIWNDITFEELQKESALRMNSTSNRGH